MPALVLCGRRWHTTTDMVCIPAGMGAFFHGIWVIIVAVESAHFQAWRVCPGSGPLFEIALGGLLAVFVLSTVNQVVMTVVSLRGAPLELRKRRWITPALYVQIVLWFATLGFLVLGTLLVARHDLACWHGDLRIEVFRLLQAMVISTWVFAGFFLFVAFIVYNAYPNRAEANTWEKRVKCVSWLFGCYKSVVRQVEGKSTPLSSIAQWLATLFGDADLTPSDLSAAIVLTMAAQHRRRRLRIRRALERSSAVLQSEAERGEASSSDQGGDSSDEDKPKEKKKKRFGRKRKQAPPAQAAPAPPPPAQAALAPPPAARAAPAPLPPPAPPVPPPPAGGPSPAADAGAQRSPFAAAQEQDKGQLASPRHAPRERPAAAPAAVTAAAAPAAAPDGGRCASVDAALAGIGPLACDSVRQGETLESIREARRSELSDGADAAVTVTLGGVPEEAPVNHGVADVGAADRTSVDGRASMDGRASVDGRGPADGRGSLDGRGALPGGGSAAGSGALEKAMSQTASGFLMKRQISERFPTVITPSEQAVEVAEKVDGVDENEAHKHYLADLDTVPYALLEEAREYARFATAVYCVQPFRDPNEPDPPPGPRPCPACGRDTRAKHGAPSDGGETATRNLGRRQSGGPRELAAADDAGVGPGADGHGDAAEKEPGRVDTDGKGEKVGCCGGGCGTRNKTPSEAAVRASIAEIGHCDPGDVLYLSPSNEVLAHLPYMVALHRKRRAVVVAIRGTSSLADLVTDAVVHPEAIDDWLPPAQAKKAQGRAFAHAGIVAAASALLIDLDETGVLSGLLRSEEDRKEAVQEGAEQGQPVTVDGSPANGPTPDGSSELPHGQPPAGDARPGGAAGEGRAGEAGGAGEPKLTTSLSKRTGRDRVGDVAETGAAETQGEAVGTIIQKNVDTKGWDLVLTGHSLGAGAAALIALKLRSRFPDLRCWSFCPPGGLVSKALQPALEGWCTSLVAGKDAVPRSSTNNLRRLMDEMITALARCRYHKLRVLVGGFWRKENRPPSDHLFRPYADLPQEARDFLVKYYRSVERRQRDIAMFPPGRVIFVRPLKVLSGKHGPGRKLEKRWDCVWVTPEQLMSEGILISKKMLEDHLIQSTVLDALAMSLKHHPERAPEASAKPGRRERRDLKRTARETRRANDAIMRGKLPQGAAATAARRASQDVRR